MSYPVVAICQFMRLIPGLGRVPQDLPIAKRASLGTVRLTVFGLFDQSSRSVCRLPRYSSVPPMEVKYYVHIFRGARYEIRLVEYPHA